MNHTYKLDERGIPYRVTCVGIKAEPEEYPEAVLVPHDGALSGFHLYALSF